MRMTSQFHLQSIAKTALKHWIGLDGLYLRETSSCSKTKSKRADATWDTVVPSDVQSKPNTRARRRDVCRHVATCHRWRARREMHPISPGENPTWEKRRQMARFLQGVHHLLLLHTHQILRRKRRRRRQEEAAIERKAMRWMANVTTRATMMMLR